tara:strand:+ start:77629 stop:78330 length:702 start_codon:yes stop_codon:yes gene_type:complete
MFFLVDTKKKIIFGWNAKCGCSHIKEIFWFFQTGSLKNDIGVFDHRNQLPNDIENYNTIIIIRNPYKRLVSGFLDKYKQPTKHDDPSNYRNLWKESFLSFSSFVDKLINCDWKVVEPHHFTPQTSDHFDKKILFSKTIKFYDICKIDYEYIEQLYNKKIPDCILNKKQGHERFLSIKNAECHNKYVYDLHIDDYIDYNIDVKYFYNEDIKEKVFNFYINDFTLFKENGFDFSN